MANTILGNGIPAKVLRDSFLTFELWNLKPEEREENDPSHDECIFGSIRDPSEFVMCSGECLHRERSVLNSLLKSAFSRYARMTPNGKMPFRALWGIILAEDSLHVATLVDHLRDPKAFLGRLLLPGYSRLTLEDAETLQRLTHMAYEYDMLGATFDANVLLLPEKSWLSAGS
jgi:hypothetical protein